MQVNELLKQSIGSNLAGLPVTPDQINTVSSAVIADLSVAFGGFPVYIPVDRKAKNSDRNSAILAAVKAGGNRQEICRQFGVSYSWLKRIIKKAEAGSDGAA